LIQTEEIEKITILPEGLIIGRIVEGDLLIPGKEQ